MVKLQFFYINICCFVIIHRNADTNKRIWIYIFFHANFTSTIYGQNLHNYLILARSRDVIEPLARYWARNILGSQHTLRHWSRGDSIPHMLFPIGAPLKPSPYQQALASYSTPNISWSRPWHFGVTWRHRACDHLILPCSISYRCSIVTDYLQSFSRYRALNILGSRPWPFKVTWRQRSHDDTILHMQFPISAPLEPSPYIKALSRYLAPNISGSQPWPFEVTWRHWPYDHLMPHIAFPIGVPL